MARQSFEYKGISQADRFSFEENFDVISWTNVLKEYRYWTIPISALYVLLVFSGRRWMEHRPAYRLKGALILWNILLGGFSVYGAWRSVPVLAKAVFYNGWHSTVCDNVYYHKDFLGVWGLFFTLSKLPELGDTLFIVLRKQKLMFLHWYHHASVPIFVVAVYSSRTSPGVWFTVMNYFVHGLMYPYYGLRAAGIRLPKSVAMTITSLQIIQMLMGNILVVYAAVMSYTGKSCHVGQGELAVAMVFYFTYLILFAQFFYTSYLGNKRVGTKPTKDDDKVKGLKSASQVVINGTSGEGIRKREFDRNENRMDARNGKH